MDSTQVTIRLSVNFLVAYYIGLEYSFAAAFFVFVSLMYQLESVYEMRKG